MAPERLESAVHESQLDLLPAEAAFQRAATSAKDLAKKLSSATSLEHASTRRLAELADLLDAARALYDVTETEAARAADPGLHDTQVAEVDASLLALAEPMRRRR